MEQCLEDKQARHFINGERSILSTNFSLNEVILYVYFMFNET